MQDDAALAHYRIQLETAKRSPVTINDRIMELVRVAAFLNGTPLLAATADQLYQWQTSIRHLRPNTIRVYTTHLQQFYGWALDSEYIDTDPSRRLIRPRIPKAVPHPMRQADIETLFAICTDPILRLVFALAAFAGLRCGEIARLRRVDLDLYAPAPTMLVHGKGNRERRVPLIPALMEEIHAAGRGSIQRGGAIVTTRDGRTWQPNALSARANEWLHGVLGSESTLHSLRAWFATNVVRITKDPLFVRDLLGHSSVMTTEIYIAADADDQHARLSEFAAAADKLSNRRHLRAVK